MTPGARPTQPREAARAQVVFTYFLDCLLWFALSFSLPHSHMLSLLPTFSPLPPLSPPLLTQISSSGVSLKHTRSRHALSLSILPSTRSRPSQAEVPAGGEANPTTVPSPGGTRVASHHDQLLSRAGFLFIVGLWTTADSGHRFNPPHSLSIRSLLSTGFPPDPMAQNVLMERDSPQLQEAAQDTPAAATGASPRSEGVSVHESKQFKFTQIGLFLSGIFSQMKQSTACLC